MLIIDYRWQQAVISELEQIHYQRKDESTSAVVARHAVFQLNV